MKRLGGIWEQIVDPDNLYLAFRKAAKGKRWLDVVRRVERNPDKYMNKLQQILQSGQYKTSRYKERSIYEPKFRIIHSLPFFPDRIVHHAILNILGPYWDSLFIYDSYACRTGKGQHAGSNRCMQFVRKYKYVLKCDVSKFYHSIPHNRLKLLLRRKLKDKKVLALLDEIIDSSCTCDILKPGKGVPIGNLVSQWLGNLYLDQLDRFIKQTHKMRGYVRYCDDFVIFSNDKQALRQLAVEINSFVADTLGLKLSKCELFPVSQGVDFLGYRHFNNYILIRKSTARRIKRRLQHIKQCISMGTIRLKQFMGQVASARGWVKHANSYNFQRITNIDAIWEWLNVYKANYAV